MHNSSASQSLCELDGSLDAFLPATSCNRMEGLFDELHGMAVLFAISGALHVFAFWFRTLVIQPALVICALLVVIAMVTSFVGIFTTSMIYGHPMPIMLATVVIALACVGVVSLLAMFLALLCKLDSKAKAAGERFANWCDKIRRRALSIVCKHWRMILSMIVLQRTFEVLGMPDSTNRFLHKLAWMIYFIVLEQDDEKQQANVSFSLRSWFQLQGIFLLIESSWRLLAGGGAQGMKGMD